MKMYLEKFERGELTGIYGPSRNPNPRELSFERYNDIDSDDDDDENIGSHVYEDYEDDNVKNYQT